MSSTEPIGYDDDGNPEYGTPPASAQELSSDQSTATLDPTTSTLTLNIEMAKSTEYAKEKKGVAAYLKLALPDTAITNDASGKPIIDPAFLEAVDKITQAGLNVLELAVARQHGLEVSSDGDTVRVMNLFPGSSAGTAVPKGAFTAPAAVPAMAPAAAAAPPVAAPAAPAVAPAPVQPGAFPAAPAAPQQGGARTPSANPLAWSNQSVEQKQALANTIEAWVVGGGTNGTVTNRMVNGERYPGVTVHTVAGVTNGDVKIGGKTMLGHPNMGPQTKAWAQQCVAAGVSLD